MCKPRRSDSSDLNQSRAGRCYHTLRYRTIVAIDLPFRTVAVRFYVGSRTSGGAGESIASKFSAVIIHEFCSPSFVIGRRPVSDFWYEIVSVLIFVGKECIFIPSTCKFFTLVALLASISLRIAPFIFCDRMEQQPDCNHAKQRKQSLEERAINFAMSRIANVNRDDVVEDLTDGEK